MRRAFFPALLIVFFASGSAVCEAAEAWAASGIFGTHVPDGRSLANPFQHANCPCNGACKGAPAVDRAPLNWVDLGTISWDFPPLTPAHFCVDVLAAASPVLALFDPKTASREEIARAPIAVLRC